MSLSDLYEVKTTLSEEKVRSDFDDILFFQSFIWVNDLDIWSWDYFKLKHKWKVQKGPTFNVDYITLLKKTILTASEGTEEYDKQKKKYDIYLQKLDNANRFLKEKVSEDFLKWLVYFILLPHQKEELMTTWDVDFSVWRSWSNYRLNCSFDELGEGRVWVFFTIRKLRKKPYTIQEMEVTKTMLEKFNLSSWLILISWPTWSAKSSTLISILDYYNKNKYLKIVTLEDPVEFFWSDLQDKCTFRQREIWKTVDSFSNWIRAAMRQDPDVIVVWELRDRQSVEMAIEAAGTWHLVISTVHVNSTIQVLDRVLGFFEGADRNDIANKLASSLKFVLNQRLVTTEKDAYRVAYEWLDTTADGVWPLIKENNLPDLKKRMYEVDAHWNSHHKPLNESLFELVCEWHLAYSRASIEYSNDMKSFDTEFEWYSIRYCQLKNISRRELQERLSVVDELSKRKKEIED